MVSQYVVPPNRPIPPPLHSRATGCRFHVKRRYTYREVVESEFLIAGSARLPFVVEYRDKEAWACVMCDWASFEHVVHDLRRGIGNDPDVFGTMETVEYVWCTGCEMLAVMPGAMPSYGSIDRLWRRG